MEDRCVMCGEIIPEGRQICPRCEKGKTKMENEKIAINRAEVSWTFWQYLCFKCKADPFKTKDIMLTVTDCYTEEYQHTQEVKNG